MNIFKINKSLAINIYALSGYLLVLSHIIAYLIANAQIPVIYFFFVIVISYFCYINYFLPVLLLILLFELLIKKKKNIFLFSDEYAHDKLAIIYFWLGILLNFVGYYLTYRVYLALPHE